MRFVNLRISSVGERLEFCLPHIERKGIPCEGEEGAKKDQPKDSSRGIDPCVDSFTRQTGTRLEGFEIVAKISVVEFQAIIRGIDDRSAGLKSGSGFNIAHWLGNDRV